MSVPNVVLSVTVSSLSRVSFHRHFLPLGVATEQKTKNKTKKEEEEGGKLRYKTNTRYWKLQAFNSDPKLLTEDEE